MLDFSISIFKNGGPSSNNNGISFGNVHHNPVPPIHHHHHSNNKEPKQSPTSKRQHHHHHRHHHSSHHDKHDKKLNPFDYFMQLSPSEKAILVALGIFLAPEAISASLSYAFTVMTFGPCEAAAIEILANASFVQAAARAGAVVSSVKTIDLFKLFKPFTPAPQLTHAQLAAFKHLTPDQLIKMAINKGVATPKDSLVLWSGLSNGVRLSKDFVRKNGGMTLEMTPGGKWLDSLNLFAPNSPYSYDDALLIWRKVSLEMIKQASGQVRSVLGRVRHDSVYMAELTELQRNPKILGIDTLQLEPRIFKP